jgi:hypothetical protein
MQAPQSGQNASLVAFISKFDIQGSRSSDLLLRKPRGKVPHGNHYSCAHHAADDRICCINPRS